MLGLGLTLSYCMGLSIAVYAAWFGKNFFGCRAFVAADDNGPCRNDAGS